MVELRVVQHLDHGMNRAGFGVVGTVNQAFQPGMNYCARTHRTRLNCSKQFTVAEAVVTDGGTGLAQGHDLRVGGGIRVGKITVPAPANDAALANHDRAYGDLARLQSALGSAQGFFHPEFVGKGSGQWLVVNG